jgi:hypothetical protein
MFWCIHYTCPNQKQSVLKADGWSREENWTATIVRGFEVSFRFFFSGKERNRNISNRNNMACVFVGPEVASAVPRNSDINKWAGR